jgi:hypothetical protein
MRWIRSHRADPDVVPLADRHYTTTANCPAHAGIDLGVRYGNVAGPRLPRARGDRPPLDDDFAFDDRRHVAALGLLCVLQKSACIVALFVIHSIPR